MPCRKENYIFLEQSVTVDSKEVDALVTRIGEALQLHNNSGNHAKKAACLHGLTTGVGSVVNPAGVGGGGVGGTIATGAPVPKRQGCCIRLRNRGSSRASPYHIPGSSDQEWDQIKPWNKKRLHADEDDPHRLLQELILSGNLIKEAVKRLQFSAADCGDFPKAADNVPC
ncbi:glycogen synthase kinase binding protein [Syngnathus acus]|uniref:glycogen synthase kinase binding protein n=1 Tax=Syngnathus acus TaxID=161584 RepID=UPI001886495C|nr:glycogen synthase kinase binding protein [Syngnathus acus]XP_049586599.1 glycogen synthase kinase binding protein [Syngnathus scovelli]XP_061144350.1 glycogen synthase kinase binding protein [Syngnathus typhle]